MKAILEKDISGLGKRGDIKEVKEGYFRNFLMPNKLATVATKDGIKELERKDKLKKTSSKLTQEKISLELDKLAGQIIAFDGKINEKGNLYKAISAKDIAKKLVESGFGEIKVEWIMIEKPIKVAGKSELEIRTPHGKRATVFIEVRKQR
ncbi:50S ribosomal protein L9 [Candidatus Giovannonibacteria bacterium RIFCSPLOWO2_02_FULL_43_11b]|uniref:Large ribosomal subunit protein bL9 n=1 Tax=Candidatus Giovannonibacteria bacterium RIFCSPHIGHO2_12_FULL_43_15 TaxID=1798341 RepID=A0A1F5WQN9_9BACT|nr:MAG: 50S ribosomal protein L9 [Candidatus Giovannonibacteria bacterium RIFCSPHIGHO2_01_FULL_43_100]OGF67816.1 MAG: 50S ribosomal protein L9 [Candidatus Giovannonibacteria bacterium RIFCSPHIGHO2_02_FULL_43_32]OGF77976.1 MAG: 50S ribosomal protein L9 [Candidatus Giovannonibacteria bacterium RIFCSPHIGHO2_12_FULL_43_15]OGF79497.1 MAG: 50S ribosomal protein L9 [Candidatus Giovannonibacteria bacterium RIFCSPLOWO2_01_FULL_43_60]OGF89227.1 MAG: 50S ribosomal protein L9 [Candidatus Giovannonibacteria